MLARIAELRQNGRIAVASGRGVLVKAAKGTKIGGLICLRSARRRSKASARPDHSGIAVVAGSTIVAEPETHRCDRRRAAVRPRRARAGGRAMTARPVIRLNSSFSSPPRSRVIGSAPR